MPASCPTVRTQIARGLGGLAAAVGALLVCPTCAVSAAGLLAVAVYLWRGCPTCWTFGLLDALKKQKADKIAKAAPSAK